MLVILTVQLRKMPLGNFPLFFSLFFSNKRVALMKSGWTPREGEGWQYVLGY